MKTIKSIFPILVIFLILIGLNNACVKGTDPEQEEMERLAEFLKVNNVTEDPKPSGLYYLEQKEGEGEAPVVGDTVGINFVQSNIMGYVSNTNIEEKAKEYNLYDPSFTYEPYRFALGDTAIIAGINEGIGYMKQGGEATLVIPSSIGFQNYETVLAFIELVEVKKESN